MSRLHALAVMLSVTLALTFADPLKTTAKQSSDLKAASRQLISDIRRTVVRAKDGIYLKDLRKDVLDLQNAASELMDDLPAEVSECDVQHTIKMASAGTGSHEVLTVLLAKDELAVLDGRLTLALAFLEQVTLLMDDELSLTADVGPHLTAIVFGANVTIDVIDAADKAAPAVANPISEDAVEHGNERVRRSSLFGGGNTRSLFNIDRIPLGNRGWSVGRNGLQWDSSNGRYSFSARPTFRGLKPDGFRASFTIRF